MTRRHTMCNMSDMFNEPLFLQCLVKKNTFSVVFFSSSSHAPHWHGPGLDVHPHLIANYFYNRTHRTLLLDVYPCCLLLNDSTNQWCCLYLTHMSRIRPLNMISTSSIATGNPPWLPIKTSLISGHGDQALTHLTSHNVSLHCMVNACCRSRGGVAGPASKHVAAE